MNIYILSYDPFISDVTPSQLYTFIKVNRDIFGWYQPFAGTYVLRSKADLLSLSEDFRTMFGDSTFILSYVNPIAMGGALDPKIWEWINTGVLPPPPPPPAIETNSLLDALSKYAAPKK